MPLALLVPLAVPVEVEVGAEGLVVKVGGLVAGDVMAGRGRDKEVVGEYSGVGSGSQRAWVGCMIFGYCIVFV